MLLELAFGALPLWRYEEPSLCRVAGYNHLCPYSSPPGPDPEPAAQMVTIPAHSRPQGPRTHTGRPLPGCGRRSGERGPKPGVPDYGIKRRKQRAGLCLTSTGEGGGLEATTQGLKVLLAAFTLAVSSPQVTHLTIDSRSMGKGLTGSSPRRLDHKLDHLPLPGSRGSDGGLTGHGCARSAEIVGRIVFRGHPLPCRNACVKY